MSGGGEFETAFDVEQSIHDGLCDAGDEVAEDEPHKRGGAGVKAIFFDIRGKRRCDKSHEATDDEPGCSYEQ